MMRLDVAGIGKIKSASIELDGITVIAGKNNTGKSTFGRTLYCMCNAFCHAGQSILDERGAHLQHLIASMLPFPVVSANLLVVDRIVKAVLALPREQSAKMSAATLRAIMDQSGLIPDDSLIPAIAEKITDSFQVSDDDILSTIITSLFSGEFSNQVNHLNCPDEAASVSLAAEGKKATVTLLRNKCLAFENQAGLCVDAIYLDTPLVIEDMRHYRNANRFLYAGSATRFHRDNLLANLEKKPENSGIVSGIIEENKIKDLFALIGGAVDGEFGEDKESGNMVFHERGVNRPLDIANLSSGTKQFLLIKRLLETSALPEKGVLIIDEPEIHLHPAWQVQFAQLLVLLQKQFSLTILAATHSHYFLQAVEEYGKKYGLTGRCHYYLANGEGVFSTLDDITGRTEAAYEQLAEPIDILEAINGTPQNDG
jgi:ABC-type cobalamin/Fe3+-siderophores transport system ATPase subunit